MKGWDAVGDWYDNIVGDRGHYYHKHVILPKVNQFIQSHKIQSILDVACGQGVLERQISRNISYVGVDISPTLIKKAKEKVCSKKHYFLACDATKELKFRFNAFDLATLILAAQDIENISSLFKNISSKVVKGGYFIIVMNHPCFRIPRQSSWGVDESNKLQFRKTYRYLSHLNIPIQTRPSLQQKKTQVTYYHRPLSYYVTELKRAGFFLTAMEELISDKTSMGSKARMENRAREEFPLFLLLAGKKVG